MRKLIIAAAAVAALSAPAFAQQAPGASVAPEDLKINQLVIYGDQECPPDTEDTINVCVKRPGSSEEFRIPEELRGADRPQNDAWANQAYELSRTGRTGIGSCSPVGPGGSTGCLENLIEQALAERYAGTGVNWTELVERRRAERLSRIDEESEEIEADARARGE